MEELFITTGDTTKEYQILKILSYYHAYSMTKRRFGKELTADETVQTIIEQLKKQAIELEADAIIGLRINTFPSSGAMGEGLSFNVYGTAIKFK